MVQTDISSIVYVGNNSTTAAYSVPFYFFTEADLLVVVKDAAGIEELQTLGTDYTVLGEGDPNGGSITMTWAVPIVSSVTITRDIAATQLTSYEEADAFPAKSHERALDKLTMLVQQALRLTSGGGPSDLGLAFRLSEASAGINAVVKLNDAMLGIDAGGSAILRPAGDMLGWLGQVGTVWADTPTRLNTRGAYPGQLGVQLNNRTIYIAGSTTPGDWVPFLIGTGIVAATDGVPHLMLPPAGDLVGTLESQTLYNKTLESPTIHTPTGLTKSDVGLSQVDNSSDLNKPISIATGAALALKQDKNEKGISNGYPSLDGAGKIPLAQIPDAVIGASQYQGTWNAATNTPTIPTAAVGNKGWYYSVSVAGTTNINGINSWAVGDQIISNGSVWQKIVNVSAVSSVNTKTGAVVLVPADIGLGNVDNTSDATKNAAAVTLTNKTINGANNTLTVRLDADVTNNLPVNRLNNGTGASGTTWWCGDNTWKQPPGTGDVSGPVGSNDGEAAVFSGTTGKIIRRFSGTAGFSKLSTTGFITTTPKIMGPDVDPDIIAGQTERTTWIDPDDQILVVLKTGELRRLRGKWFSHLPANHLSGYKLSNNTTDSANDIDIAAGRCRDDTDTVDIIGTAMTKRIDAVWAAGTNQGGRDTGSVTANTWWNVFAIFNATTGASDYLLSQSLASPTMPSGFTYKRRVGAIYRSVSNVIQQFLQFGDYFMWNPAVVTFSATITTGSTFNVYVPWIGKAFQANLRVGAVCTGGWAQVVVQTSNYNLGTLASSLFPPVANIWASYIADFWTSAAGTITAAVAASQGGTVTFACETLGYYDHREKDE